MLIDAALAAADDDDDDDDVDNVVQVASYQQTYDSVLLDAGGPAPAGPAGGDDDLESVNLLHGDSHAAHRLSFGSVSHLSLSADLSQSTGCYELILLTLYSGPAAAVDTTVTATATAAAVVKLLSFPCVFRKFKMGEICLDPYVCMFCVCVSVCVGVCVGFCLSVCLSVYVYVCLCLWMCSAAT